MDTLNTIQRGKIAEEKACAFLQTQGLRLIERNYYCAQGEIDLIMQDADEIVFIEVRARQDSNYGSAIESVNTKKQKKLLKAAHHFLVTRHWFGDVNYRFDVIGIEHKNEKMTIDWIENAFSI